MPIWSAIAIGFRASEGGVTVAGEREDETKGYKDGDGDGDPAARERERESLRMRLYSVAFVGLALAGLIASAGAAHFGARGRALQQADSAREDLTTYSKQCIPRCTAGRWYTFGIPTVSCVHEEELEWLNKHICKEDVRLSQLMPLLPKPEECSLKHLKHWLEETCNFPFPSAKLDESCRPRCKQPRWYTLGIPVPDCNQLEYDIWLNDFICSEEEPVSVQMLMDTADDPTTCNLNDLSYYLRTTCQDVQSWSPGARSAGAVGAAGTPPASNSMGPSSTSGGSSLGAFATAAAAGRGKSGGFEPLQADMPIFGAKNSEKLHSLSFGGGKITLPRPSFEKIYGPSSSTETTETSSTAPRRQGPTPQPQDQLDGSAGYYLEEGYDPSYGGAWPQQQQQQPQPPPPRRQPFQLSMESCGFVQAADGGISTVPVVLKITGGEPHSQIAIFRSRASSAEDPLAAVSVPDNLKCAGTGLGLGGTFFAGPKQVKAWQVSTQGQGDALFKIDGERATTQSVCSEFVYQAVDMSTCRLSNVLDSRSYQGATG